MPPLDAATAGKDDWVTAPAPAPATAAAAPAAAAPEGKDDWVTAPAQPHAAPLGGEFGDLAAQVTAPAPEPGAIQRVIGAAAQGAVEGYGNPDTILSPKAQEWMDAKQREGGVGGFLAGLGSTAAEDVGKVGGAIAGATSALYRGAQGAVAQTGAELGAPQLGRDIASIPDAFMGSPHMLERGPPITALQVQARDGVGIMEAWNRAHAENTAAIADIGKATDIDGAIAAAGKAAESPATGGLADTLAGADALDAQAAARQPVVSAEDAGRASAMGDQTAASALPDADVTAPDSGTSRALPYQALPAEPKRLIQFLREPTTHFEGTPHAFTIPGGVQDVGGDVAAAIGGPKGRPGLISNTGRTLDDATQHAWDGGYFPDHDQRPEINDLLNAISEDHNGLAQYSINDQDAVAARQYAQDHNEEIDRIAAQTGIDTRGMTRDQFFDAVSDHLSSQEQAAAQNASDAEHQDSFDKAIASAKSDGVDFGTTTPRSLAELDDEYRQEEAARPAIDSAPNAAGSGPVAPDAGSGQTGGGQGGSVTGVVGRDGTQASVAGQSAPQPQSVGAAAASRDTTALTAFGRTAREIRGQQADMELADLMRTPQPGDARDIVPGATQTRSEIEQKPSVSLEAKGLRQEFRDGFTEHEKENNDIYHQHINDVVPTAEMRGTMADMREANWKAREQTVFGGTPNDDLFGAEPHGDTAGADPNGQPVSTAPVVKHITDLLARPVEKHNSYLKKEFQPFLDAMTDDKGKPVVIGAKELFGIREEMGRKVKDMATNTDLAHVRSQFGDLMKATDDTITTAAPDYRAMMDEYKAASGPINAAERLGDMPLKITNGSDRVITFGQLDRYMKALWAERNGPNAYAKAKSIPQSTWDHLMLLHERLARSASSKELAKAQGSDTSQMMMELARKGAIGGLHAVVGAATHGVGNIVLPTLIKQFDHARGAKRVDRELRPKLSRYPTPQP